MKYRVLLTAGAERDLEEICDHITESDSKAAADHVLDRLLEVAADLALLPERGSIPKELRALGIREFRQLFFKPYRVICRTVGRDVFIVLVADGRREMQSLLGRRLLGGC
jgi:toxin ParE1/3/4